MERNTGWPTKRLSLWLVPAGYRTPAGHRAGPWIWRCKRGNVRRPRAIGPHERFGKPFTGMLPKEKGAPWRRSNFQKAGMLNTWPALHWHCRENPPGRRRSPAISKSDSRKIRSPSLITYRFFARYRRYGAGNPRRASSGCRSLCNMSWRRMASTSIIFILVVCTRPMCAARHWLPHTGMRKRSAEFQKILDHRGIVGADPIGALAHLQLGRVYALSGDKAKAKAAYQDFLTLWKDADPDIPILKQAKAEYAKLQ